MRVVARHLVEKGYAKSPPKLHCFSGKTWRGRVRQCGWSEPEVLGKRSLSVDILFLKRATELLLMAVAEPDGPGKDALLDCIPRRDGPDELPGQGRELPPGVPECRNAEGPAGDPVSGRASAGPSVGTH